MWLDSGYISPKESTPSLLMMRDGCERKRGVKGVSKVSGFCKNNHHIC